MAAFLDVLAVFGLAVVLGMLALAVVTWRAGKGERAGRQIGGWR
jgi:hypothetical protein